MASDELSLDDGCASNNRNWLDHIDSIPVAHRLYDCFVAASGQILTWHKSSHDVAAMRPMLYIVL
jgi:hypothetical protein